MENIVYRCDNCGKLINERDFDWGATKTRIEDVDHFGDDPQYDIICIDCNKK